MRRTGLAALLLAAGCLPAPGADDIVIRHERVAGAATVRITWDVHALAAGYRVVRHDSPRDVESAGLLLDTVAAPGFDDIAPPSGNQFYLVLLDCTDEDPFEPNDTLADAAMPMPPDLADELLMLCPGDEDWFAGPGLAGGRLRGEIRYDTVDGPRVLELHGGDPPRLLAWSDTGSGREEIQILAPEDATYAFRVVGPDGVGALYRADLCYPDVPCVDEASEPNDTVAAAVPIVGGTASASLCGLDEDWFSFDGFNGAIVSVTVTVPPGSEAGRVTLELVDTDGETVLAQSNDGSVGRQLFGGNETYYVRVTNPLSCGEGAYDLELRLF